MYAYAFAALQKRRAVQECSVNKQKNKMSTLKDLLRCCGYIPLLPLRSPSWVVLLCATAATAVV